MATVMLNPGFTLHYKMRSNSCFDRALWVIKPCADELYFQFDDDTVDSWGCYGVSFTLLSLNLGGFFSFSPCDSSSHFSLRGRGNLSAGTGPT